MDHHFNPDIAVQVGVNAAILYENILFWTEKNFANEKHIHGDYVYTYNTNAAFEQIFPYLTGYQIRTALKKLEDEGMIVTGNFNQVAYDRTKWFGVLCKIHLLKSSNGIVEKLKPIPDNKPYNKPDIKDRDENNNLFSAIEEPLHQEQPDQQGIEDKETNEALFNEWWENWPSHQRKAAKAKCRELYLKSVTGKNPNAEPITGEQLNRATMAYLKSVRDMQYLKAPLAWLRVPGWEPFVGEDEPVRNRYQEIIARNQT